MKSPAYTSKHQYISDVERCFYVKVGYVVIADLAFTVSQTISDNTVILFTGFPNATNRIGNIRFRIPNAYSPSVPDLVLGITHDGTITNQWSNAGGGVPAGTWQGQFLYIANSK